MADADAPNHSNFAELLELADHQVKDGEVTISLEAGEKHLNMGGVVHGGVIASLLDFALGSAVVATLGEDEWCATQSLTTDFLTFAEPGARLVAVGRVDRRGRSAAYPSGEVRDGDGRLIARATGVWAIRSG